MSLLVSIWFGCVSFQTDVMRIFGQSRVEHANYPCPESVFGFGLNLYIQMTSMNIMPSTLQFVNLFYTDSNLAART
ncbi:hypothetical protein BDV10DRAFT_95838 [Aspergillus recurvatus]